MHVIHGPHDKIFKRVMADRKNAISLLGMVQNMFTIRQYQIFHADAPGGHQKRNLREKLILGFEKV